MNARAPDLLARTIASPRGGVYAAVGIALAFFAALAPALHWEQLHDSIENLTVATALEIRRGGPWLVPDLQGVPRLAKPPLTVWLTALSIRPGTVAALNTPDRAARAAAYDRLAWQARLPALVAACLLLLFAYGLGWAVGGPRDGVAMGLTAECVCGSTLLLLRHARVATPDVQQALWVTAANFFLALAVFRGRRSLGCCGAGVALGLAFMCKGPVGLVQTVLPFALFAIVDRFLFPRRRDWRRAMKWIGPVGVGAALMVAVGGWWFVYVADRFTGLGAFWLTEATGHGATNVPPGKWYKYATSIYLFLPWLVWLACGAWMALVPAAHLPGRWGENLSNVSNVSGSAAGVASAGLDRRRAAVLGLLLLAAPLLAMSLAKDRFERYMVPMTAGAAVLAAVPLVVLSRGVDERHGNGRGEVRAGRVAVAAAVAMHWLVLVGLYASIGFAAGSSLHLRGVAGRAHWAAAAMAAGVGLAVAGAGLLWQRRWRGAVVAVTAIGMAGFQIGYYRLEARGAAARSTLRPVADLVWQKYPDAEIYAYRPDRPYVISAAGNDLSIHLNRTLRWETDPSTVPPSSHPQVFVIYRPRVPGRPPLRPPPGWKLLAKPPGLEDRYVFVRPGTPP